MRKIVSENIAKEEKIRYNEISTQILQVPNTLGGIDDDETTL